MTALGSHQPTAPAPVIARRRRWLRGLGFALVFLIVSEAGRHFLPVAHSYLVRATTPAQAQAAETESAITENTTVAPTPMPLQPGEPPPLAVKPPAADEFHEEKEEHAATGHTEPIAYILFELALILIVAVLGRLLGDWARQPQVLGELLLGVLVGNIGLWLGGPMFLVIMQLQRAEEFHQRVWEEGRTQTIDEIAADVFEGQGGIAPNTLGHSLVTILTGKAGANRLLMALGLVFFSQLGVILLLFMVGLESSVDEMLGVGLEATWVALTGIVAPFVLGFLVAWILLPDAIITNHLFIAAILCATSVGITARVFKDLNALHTKEAKVILGAAVIDDVLALIILAVVAGIATTGGVDWPAVAQIVLLSGLFLGSVIFLGEKLMRSLGQTLERLDKYKIKFVFPIVLTFLFAALANAMGLAAIVGAFAAGLIINDEHFTNTRERRSLHQLIDPLESAFAPVFFVLMGMQVDLRTFTRLDTVFLAFGFSVVAIIGKLACGLVVQKGKDWKTVGLGMVPRGEVGLIFASIGRSLGVVDDRVFSAVVAMVVITTFITPPALRWSLGRQSRSASEPNAPDASDSDSQASNPHP